MSLKIETYTNPRFVSGWRAGNNVGGNTLFKALGHPLAAQAAPDLLKRLRAQGPIAIYDAEGALESFDALYGLNGVDVSDIYVQRIEAAGREVLGRPAKLLNELPQSGAKAMFVAGFDVGRHRQQLAPILPANCTVIGLDGLLLPDTMLSNGRKYLDPLNFATNFALLRDGGGWHTRVVSVNYWGTYGASDPALWLCLFDHNGRVLAHWTETLPAAGACFSIDSREVRRRFGLGDFAGSLFIHATRIAGHDVVKYALDTFSDDGKQLSCTHDANAWPADLYAGLPAPDAGERVTLWVQNSHPLAIPAGAIGLNLMGSQQVAPVPVAVPPFGTQAIDVSKVLPNARWPQQIEIQAGRHFVRPRYEIERAGQVRIAHANVERTDLEADPRIPELKQHLGKGYIMPLPVLPLDRFASVVLPTPMATCQRELPIAALLIASDGRKVAERFLGRVLRHESVAVDIDAWLKDEGVSLRDGFGHVELVYDFAQGGEADGWLHAIGRYRLRSSGHAADTSFGAHIYNTAIVYRDEPQSYTGAPPGLTTRLFLRLGDAPLETICHLIYPASLPWAPKSSTELNLFDGDGRRVASKRISIDCGGSHFWRFGETFSAAERKAAGERAFVQVRDATCRLFGFHGTMRGSSAFCLDHMFGF
ncbi:MAG TPA: hypothetical protein VEU47_10620 [Candidatus Cybelea sp.]|nr:hypothetical protein [Candidatus Cybelea sp.]